MKMRTNLLALAASLVIPFVMVAAAVIVLLLEYEQEAARNAASARARAVMSAVDAELRGSIGTLEALATAESLRHGDLAAFYRLATSVKDSQPNWTAVTVTTPGGGQLLNTLAPWGTRLPDAIGNDTIQAAAQSRKLVVGGVSRGPVLKDYAIPLRVPIVVDEQVKFILSAGIRLDSFQRLMEDQHLPSAAVLGLVDRTGTFIGRVPAIPRGSRASQGFMANVVEAEVQEGWYRGLTVEGADTFTAFTKSALSGWSLGHAVPIDAVFQSTFRAGALLSSGVAAILLLSLWIASVLSRRITQPLAQLAHHARQLPSGKPVDIEGHIPVAEFRDIREALTEASTAIRQRNELAERENRTLVEADEAKTEFVAMLSHELRNPLAAMTSAAVLQRKVNPDNPTLAFCTDVFERQTVQMTQLVNQLLDLSRLTIGKEWVKPQPADLSVVLRRILETFQKSRQEPLHEIRLRCESVWSNIDQGKIEQVVVNLLDNAVKFSPANTAIDVSLKRSGTQAAISIRDYGEGIAPDVQAKLFKLFVQAPQGIARSRGGMGVGLALSRRLIELHGGSLEVKSEGRNKGSEFIVHLPAIERPPTTQAPDSAAAKPARFRLLVVDDNDDVRQSLVTWLSSEGHQVSSAASGHEAVEKARSSRPDAVLLDIGLPDIDGYRVANMLRDMFGSGVFLAAITGYSHDAERTRDLGFDDYIVKPASNEDIQRVIKSVGSRSNGDR